MSKAVQCRAYMTTRKRGVSGGVYEVRVDGVSKYLPLNELKERSGARASQKSKLEKWLNSEEGYQWAKNVPEERIFS